MFRFVTTCVAGVLVVAASMAVSSGHGPPEPEPAREPVRVKVEDVPRRVKLLGRLGNSLGEDVVTIRGKWKDSDKIPEGHAKPEGFVFVVNSIDGKPVRVPITIPADTVTPIKSRGIVTAAPDGTRTWTAKWWQNNAVFLPDVYEGDEWEMRGVETAEIVAWPREIAGMFPPIQMTHRTGELVVLFRPVTVRMFGKPHNDKNERGSSFSFAEDEDDSKPPPKSK
jgi:hypothetical protein